MFILLSILGFLCFSFNAEADPRPFRATQNGNNIVLESPYGKRVFFGELGFANLDDYSIAIPLESLRDDATLAGNSGDTSNLNFKVEADKLIQNANLLFLKANYKGALISVDRVLEMDPGNVRALMMKGSLLHILGDKGMARKSWKKALEFDPGNKEIARILEKVKE